MAQAILARLALITCVQEWLEPFWHSNIVTGFGRIARAVLARPVKCQSGSSHSGMAIQLHYLSARMARTILALAALPVTTFECDNGLSHSGTASCIT